LQKEPIVRTERRCPSMVWVALSCLLAAPAAAQDGLTIEGSTALWPTLSSRVRLNAMLVETMPMATPLAGHSADGDRRGAQAGSLVGDYYLFSDRAGSPTGGLRASSALLFRPAGTSWSELSLGARSLATGGRAWRPAAPAWAGDVAGDGTSTLPYLGIGYSSLASRSGWGYWADVGLVVQNPAGALGLGRVVSGGQGVDDLMRELRLSPMLQLGVNYAF
jgi:hypothetical protein